MLDEDEWIDKQGPLDAQLEILGARVEVPTPTAVEQQRQVK